MNTVFLVAAVAVVFVFGYRFYAKLLALDAFHLDKNYSTPANTRADGRDFAPVNPHLLFGYHVTAAGALACAGPIVAASWGWIPAFLWITIGVAVAGGTYAFGSFWLASRHPGSLGHVTRRFLGAYARVALLALASIALLVLIAASAGLTASVLAGFPTAVLPLCALVLVGLAVGAFLRGRAEFEILPAALIALTTLLLLVWVCTRVPFAFAGKLDITLGDLRLLSVDALLVWTVLLLVYALHAARVPMWRIMRPRGFVTALLLAVALVVFYLALAIAHPGIAAPQFHSPDAGSAALPWLFLIVSAGALAGVQLLIVHGVSGRQLRNETDARYIGYGGALVEGAIALSALLIAATAVADGTAWSASFGAPSAADFLRALALYVDGYARVVATLGVDPALARNLAATVVAALSLAGLEASMRALKQLWAPAPVASTVPGATAPRRQDGRGRLWAIALVAGVLALLDGRGFGGLAAWPLAALAGLWLAAGGFALMAQAARAAQQSTGLLWALAGSVGALAAWSTAVQLLAWWDAGDWGGLALGLVIVLLVAGAIAGSLRGNRADSADPAPAEPLP